MPVLSLETPVGELSIHEDDGQITQLAWGAQGQEQTDVLQEAKSQLLAYFAGELRQFALPLRIDASPFVQKVCDVMRAIPYGDTMTYGEIADQVGVAAQPVGQACGANPIPIIIPCHRVLSASGLGGFSGAGGVETKIELLKLEGAGGFLI